ncbi:hypothetical protein RJT34_18707 [Clitoria ternatea]|uniref:Uncharacterized protein n=1 Tax=Clitoria ternatea TaxID=43366 RepID=A0AAN9JBB0_CLITE
MIRQSRVSLSTRVVAWLPPLAARAHSLGFSIVSKGGGRSNDADNVVAGRRWWRSLSTQDSAWFVVSQRRKWGGGNRGKGMGMLGRCFSVLGRGFCLDGITPQVNTPAVCFPKGGTDILVHDEGEPSSHLTADFENQFYGESS